MLLNDWNHCQVTPYYTHHTTTHQSIQGKYFVLHSTYYHTKLYTTPTLYGKYQQEQNPTIYSILSTNYYILDLFNEF